VGILAEEKSYRIVSSEAELLMPDYSEGLTYGIRLEETFLNRLREEGFIQMTRDVTKEVMMNICPSQSTSMGERLPTDRQETLKRLQCSNSLSITLVIVIPRPSTPSGLFVFVTPEI
jgi:hypothetical protein